MYKANPELTLKVDKINASDFYHGDGTMLTMLRHTANNPLDISSGVVGNLLIFDTRRIYEMADQLQLSVVGPDFGALAGVLLKHGLDIVEIVDNVPHRDPSYYKDQSKPWPHNLRNRDIRDIIEGRQTPDPSSQHHPAPIPPTMIMVLQQDECAPDSYECFCRFFHQIVGEDFKTWKDTAKKQSIDDGYEFRWTYGDFMVTISADHQFWTLWRTNKPTP